MMIGIFVCLLILLLVLHHKRQVAMQQTARMVLRVRTNQKEGERLQMIELAKAMIGKDCVIYTFNSSQAVRCVIQEVRDNALLVATGEGGKGSVTEVINLDFVFRIREIPLKKNGKPRSAVY